MNVSKNKTGLLFSTLSQGPLKPLESTEALGSTVYTIDEVIIFEWIQEAVSKAGGIFFPHQGSGGPLFGSAPIGPLLPIEFAYNTTHYPQPPPTYGGKKI